MTLHNEIMNIQCDPDPTLSVRADVGYKMGHRDARHAAARLSLKYERYIDELEQLVETHGREASWQVDLEELKKECGL